MQVTTSRVAGTFGSLVCAGTAIVGMWALGESASPLKLVSIGLILAGVIGLNLSGVT